MITGVHALIYTTKPDEMRQFFSDVLEFSSVDAGRGWLVFALPPAEVALHPIDAGQEHHELTLMCDDIAATMATLRDRGVQFEGHATDRGWGISAQMVLPDGSQLMLYQPRHAVAAR